MFNKKLIVLGAAFIFAVTMFLGLSTVTLAAPPSCNWPPLDPQSWQKCLDDVATEAAQKAVAAYIASHPAGTTLQTTAPYTGTLTYDRTAGKTLATNQQKYIADYINTMIFAKGTTATEADVIAAIQAIQLEAQTVGAEVHQGQMLELPSDRAWLVWCSNGDNCTTRPADVSDVFGTNVNAKGKIWIQVVFDSNVNPRVFKKWQSTENLWAVALW